MSLKKFGRSDIIRNAMRAFPHSSFLIYDSQVYYDHRPIESGSFSDDILSASGGISLFEYNIDKQGTTAFDQPAADQRDESTVTKTGLNPPIIPYVVKASNKQYLKAGPRTRENIQAVSDDYTVINEGPLTGSSYSMTASITRELMETAGGKTIYTSGSQSWAVPNYRHYYGLRNSLDFYATRSPQYAISGSDWNKDEQDINMVSIPKIFYGSRIKPGSISLKFYITGTLVGELQDTKYNGELIQVGPEGSTGSGSVAGVAMYEEGFVLLTGSWHLTGDPYDFGDGSDEPGTWLKYAAGANYVPIPGESCTTDASFNLSFKGHTETQVLTMFAHARRGEINYSNNPTFLEYGQERVAVSSSNLYIENDSQRIKNTVSSSYDGFEAPFERQVYISRVALYDDEKKLIGVATLSNPVLKKEAQDLSFKLKLDI